MIKIWILGFWKGTGSKKLWQIKIIKIRAL
jgi:hypothetical protein